MHFRWLSHLAISTYGKNNVRTLRTAPREKIEQQPVDQEITRIVVFISWHLLWLLLSRVASPDVLSRPVQIRISPFLQPVGKNGKLDDLA